MNKPYSADPLAHDGSMKPERIALDPAFPLCWENTETLRVGFDRAEVRLHSPTPAAQRFIDKLRSGLYPREITNVANKSGLLADERALLMHQLAPVLVRVPEDTSRDGESASGTATFAVLGVGAFARGVRERFSQAGFLLAQDGTAPGFVILIEQFLGTTDRAQALLSSDIAHLLLRVTDRHLFLGPLVLPGGMPCLTCVELHGLDSEPSMHVLAAQLAAELPAAATPQCVELVSSSAIAVARRWQQGVYDLVGARLRFPVHRGLPSAIPDLEKISSHPDCGCVSLTQSN